MLVILVRGVEGFVLVHALSSNGDKERACGRCGYAVLYSSQIGGVDSSSPLTDRS